MSSSSIVRRWGSTLSARGKYITKKELILGDDSNLAKPFDRFIRFDFGIQEDTDKFTRKSAEESCGGDKIICNPEALRSTGRSLSFSNNTRSTIAIVDRANFITTIRPASTPNVGAETIDITVTYGTPHTSPSELTLHPLSSENEVSYRESLSNNCGVMGLTYVHRVYLKDVIKSNNSIYIHELDILISLREQDYIPLHPYSRDGFTRRCLANILSSTITGSSAVCFEIIDNNDEYGNKYINVGGSVIKINAVKRDDCLNGLYISFKGLVENDYMEDMGEAHCIPFKEVEEVYPSVFFNSYKEALDLGSMERQRELQVKGMEQEHKVEMERLKKENLEHEKEVKRLKLTIEEVKKDTVVETSSVTKDTTDVKFYIAVAGAVAAGVALVGKIFSLF